MAAYSDCRDCKEVNGHSMGMRSPRRKDHSDFVAMFESQETFEDSQDLHRVDLPASNLLPVFLPHPHTVNGDHCSGFFPSHVTTSPKMEMMPTHTITPDLKMRSLIADKQAIVDKHTRSLEDAVLPEKVRVKSSSAFVLQQHEAGKLKRNAEIEELRGQVWELKERLPHLELSNQEERRKLEYEIKQAEEKLEDKVKEHKKLTSESEMKVLDQMKLYLEVQVKEEKLRRLLAESKRSLLKVQNALVMAKCNAVKAE